MIPGLEWIFWQAVPLVVKYLLPKGVKYLQQLLEDNDDIKNEFKKHIMKVIPSDFWSEKLWEIIKDNLPLIVDQVKDFIAQGENIESFDAASAQIVANLRLAEDGPTIV